MKNKILKTVYLICFIVAFSCERNDISALENFENGAIVNITKDSTTDAFINLNDLQENKKIKIGFKIEQALGEISAINIIGLYIKQDGSVHKGTLATNITKLPITYLISQTEIITAFAILNSVNDFKIGDKLIITAEIKLKNGTTLKLINDDGSNNLSPNILSSTTYTPFQSYNVSCPSDLGGTYNVISSGSSTDSGPTIDENPIANYPYTVIITDNGGGNYTISDAYGGLYILWFDIYGITRDYPGKFSDICGTISGSFTEPFDENVIYTGSVNPANGVITIDWITGYGDKAKMVLTKK